MMESWREVLMKAVSPLEQGVSKLAVNGYRPPGGQAFRPAKTAAVLVPFLDKQEPELVLTRRADHLPQHPGQVSFPGGAAEESDATAVDTALREAHEEIGLPPEAATPIGFIDRLDTHSDFRILPVVALVRPPVIWKPDFSEVAEVFTVPLKELIAEDSFSSRKVTSDGRTYVLWSKHHQGYHIWGATAAMIVNLTRRMRSIHAQKPTR
jgi:8-oxo-dGTP pyrophosphatase MutT (NUDIX family)